jgi:hypothetical protein
LIRTGCWEPLLLWTRVQFGLWLELNFLLDTVVPVRRIQVTEGDRLCSVHNWFDESVELAVNERDAAYKVWPDNINRVREDRLWILYDHKRRYADGVVERKYGCFVSVNLYPSLPQRKLYQNLRGLEVVNAPERLQVEMVVERLNNYFLTRPLLNGAGELAVSRTIMCLNSEVYQVGCRWC